MPGQNRGTGARWLLPAAGAGLCLLFAALGHAQPAPSTDGLAKVLSLEGQVSVIRDSSPWALRVGDTVQPRQMIVTGPDGFAKFQVSDGSTFEVFPNSRFSFRNNSDWKDLIDMWIGRVKVHIQKWGGQPNHNRIHTPTAVISVRGTVFDVEVEDEDSTLVVVEEGQVAVQHKLLPSSQPKLLNTGEWLRVYRNQPLAKSSVFRDSVIRTALRAMTDALYSVVYRAPGGTPFPGGSGGPGTGGGGLPGDHGGKQPPTAPGGGASPPPAPPPPPPGK